MGVHTTNFPPVDCGRRRDRLLEEFARSLDSRDALLLFPEGGNWSPRRHAASIAWAIENDNARLRAWMESQPRVLAPGAKGTREMLEESPTLVPVIATHRGLEETAGPASSTNLGISRRARPSCRR